MDNVGLSSLKDSSFCLVFQQLRHNQQQISVLQNEVDTLRSDNVKLYEKIKFLQSYPTKVYQLLRNFFVLNGIKCEKWYGLKQIKAHLYTSSGNTV